MGEQRINEDTYMDVSEEARERLRAHGVTDRAQQDAWFARSGALLADALAEDDRWTAEETLSLRGSGSSVAPKPHD